MEILFRNQSYVVAVKDPGCIAEHGANGMPELLSQALSVASDRIYPVHRLDMATGGVMVYALNSQAAGKLSTAIANHQFHKRYLVVVERAPAEASSTLTDLLFWDRVKKKSYIVTRNRKGVKEAELSYRTLACTSDHRALLMVKLATGRTHQIRVQFSSRGYPLVGDRKYGSHTSGTLGLWAFELSFPDPDTGEPVSFSRYPPLTSPWNDTEFIPFLEQDHEETNHKPNGEGP